MAVIHCPECDGVVPDRSNKCPHCGKQIPMSVRYPQFYKNDNPITDDSNNLNNKYFYDNNTFRSDNAPVSQEYSSPSPYSVKNENKVSCPKCGSTNISYQREQTASFGAGTNKVVVQQAKKSKGCLWWMTIGFWWVPIYWLLIGWWWRPLFGRHTKSGLNFNANKTINRTMAICQNCGNSWKV